MSDFENTPKSENTPQSENIIQFPNMNIGNVKINANVNGNFVVKVKKSRPNPIPIENPINPPHQLVLKELSDKIVDLGLIIGDYQSKEKAYPIVRGNLNKKLGVTTIKECSDDRFEDGREYLQRWLWALITNDKVIKNPPPWWRDYLLSGIHINLKVGDEQYRDYLNTRYSVKSAEELNNIELAKVFNYSKTGKFDVSRIKENIRDFNLRMNSFSRWLDEMEQACEFDRMNIRMTKEQIHEVLKEYEPTLWQIALSTFLGFWSKAKKILKFDSKRGARPKASR